MKITEPKFPLFGERCNATGLHPNGFFSPPNRFIVHDTENGLIDELRDCARNAMTNTESVLADAVIKFLDGDQELAFAFADLTVTGKNAFSAFNALHPTDVLINAAVITRLGTNPRIADAVTAVLNRAYETLWTIRHRGNTRNLGWIAVCAEVDHPHRPVNIPSTKHTQYDIDVNIRRNGDAPAFSLKTRFAIFDNQNIPAEIDLANVIANRLLPPVTLPQINPDGKYLFYIHGH